MLKRLVAFFAVFLLLVLQFTAYADVVAEPFPETGGAGIAVLPILLLIAALVVLLLAACAVTLILIFWKRKK